MGGRGTGHFGTGWYTIGKYDPSKAYSYGKRAAWEIDMDKYNLFKPKSNNEGYKLHDALKEINQINPDILKSKNIDTQLIKERVDEIIDKTSVQLEDIEELYPNLDSEEQWDKWISGDYDEDEIITKERLNKIKNELKEYLLNININENEIDNVLYDFDRQKYYDIEKDIENIVDKHQSEKERFDWAIKTLSNIFNKNIIKEALNAILSEDQEDSKSTVFMKSLGYEGVDVSRLNHDADGLSGLDNFTYGSVIYDLKPGTFKRIKEKDEVK